MNESAVAEKGVLVKKNEFFDEQGNRQKQTQGFGLGKNFGRSRIPYAGPNMLTRMPRRPL